MEEKERKDVLLVTLVQPFLHVHTIKGEIVKRIRHESRMTSPNLTPVFRQRSHQGRTYEEIL